ncbi:MAG: aldo/keto reductase [Cyanophyceae cyanobacterium]
MSTASPPLTLDIKPIQLPKMGCGTWAWGNRLLWNYDPTMDDDLQQVFNLCVNNGVTLFDTGDSYGTGKLNGRSESLLGKFAITYTGENHDALCLATKLAPYPWRLTRQSIIDAANASRDRMGRLDLAQLHWSTANYAPWQEPALLNGLCDLYEQGIIRGVGLSNFGPKRLRKMYPIFRDRQIPILTLQIQYSLLSTYPVTDLGLKETCDELGIKIIAYSPLCLGVLTGKYSDDEGTKPSYPKGLRNLLFRQLIPNAEPVVNCLQAIAKERDKTPAQIALNWCMVKGTIPIPGAKNLKQAQDNLGATGWLLDNGEVDALDKAAASVSKPMVQNVFQSR